MSSLKDKLGLLAGTETVMELRLFRLLCLAASLLSLLVVVPADYLTHLAAWMTLMDLAFGVAAFFLYREACRGNYLIKSLYCLFLLNLNLSWLPTGGSQGSISLYFFNLFIFALIFFRGRERWLLLGGGLADVLLLLAAEPYFPQLPFPYQSQTVRLVNLASALTVSTICCSLMLWAVLSSYDREQRRLKNLNEELQRNMAERLEAEESLRQNRGLLNAVIEGTSDAVFAKDTEGRYILFNSGAALITGKSPEQALGKDDSFLFCDEEAAAIRKNDLQKQSVLQGKQHRCSRQNVRCASNGRT